MLKSLEVMWIAKCPCTRIRPLTVCIQNIHVYVQRALTSACRIIPKSLAKK